MAGGVTHGLSQVVQEAGRGSRATAVLHFFPAMCFFGSASNAFAQPGEQK